MRGTNHGVCHSCRSTAHYFRDYSRKLQCLWCLHGIQKCFQIERNTADKGQLFKTCNDDYGYFEWVNKEESSGESNTINETVGVVANKEPEDLAVMFDSLARIANKQSDKITVNMTFRKDEGCAELGGKGKGPV